MERKPQRHHTTRESPTEPASLITPLGEMKMPAKEERKKGLKSFLYGTNPSTDMLNACLTNFNCEFGLDFLLGYGQAPQIAWVEVYALEAC